MKISQEIARLQALLAEHGDIDLLCDDDFGPRNFEYRKVKLVKLESDHYPRVMDDERIQIEREMCDQFTPEHLKWCWENGADDGTFSSFEEYQKSLNDLSAQQQAILGAYDAAPWTLLVG